MWLGTKWFVELLPLKNLWKPGSPTPADYVRFLRSLLENIPTQVVDAEPEEHVQFQKELASLATALTERSSCDDINSVVSAGLGSLKNFNAISAKRSSAHVGELNSVMRAMTETITFLSESRTSVVHHLNFIERELEQASELEDIRLLRPKMLSCLEMVRQETARIQNESAAHSEVVRSQLGASPSFSHQPRKVGSLDPVTGLPGRQVAERVLTDKINEGKKCIAALFLANRLAATNRHYGRNAGDEVLLHVAQHLATNIRPPAMLCRWVGPAFLVFTEVDAQFAQVSRSWHELAAKPCEKTIEIGRRSVMLPVTLSILTKQIGPGTSPATLFQDLERFVTEQTGESWSE